MSVNQLYISNLSTLAGGTLEIKRQGVKSAHNIVFRTGLRDLTSPQ